MRTVKNNLAELVEECPLIIDTSLHY